MNTIVMDEEVQKQFIETQKFLTSVYGTIGGVNFIGFISFFFEFIAIVLVSNFIIRGIFLCILFLLTVNTGKYIFQEISIFIIVIGIWYYIKKNYKKNVSSINNSDTPNNLERSKLVRQIFLPQFQALDFSKNFYDYNENIFSSFLKKDFDSILITIRNCVKILNYIRLYKWTIFLFFRRSSRIQLQQVIVREIEFLKNIIIYSINYIQYILSSQIEEISETQKTTLQNFSNILEIEKQKLQIQKENLEKIYRYRI